MRDVNHSNFGIAIAYLLPGLVVLVGMSRLSPVVTSWISISSERGATIGGFLFATLASLAAGMVVSVIRWAVVDSLHHATGVREPAWGFASLQEHFEAFEGLVENHYRYYQFYANTFVAVLVAWFANGTVTGDWSTGSKGGDAGLVSLMVLLFLGSRDALQKYYSRSRQLLGTGGMGIRRDNGTD